MQFLHASLALVADSLLSLRIVGRAEVALPARVLGKLRQLTRLEMREEPAELFDWKLARLPALRELVVPRWVRVGALEAGARVGSWTWARVISAPVCSRGFGELAGCMQTREGRSSAARAVDAASALTQCPRVPAAHSTCRRPCPA
jgi:hypothetical protein